MNESLMSTIYAVLLVIVLILLVIVTIKALKSDGKSRNKGDEDNNQSKKNRMKELFGDSDVDYDYDDYAESDEGQSENVSQDSELSELVVEDDADDEEDFADFETVDDTTTDSAFVETETVASEEKLDEDISIETPDSAFVEMSDTDETESEETAETDESVSEETAETDESVSDETAETDESVSEETAETDENVSEETGEADDGVSEEAVDVGESTEADGADSAFVQSEADSAFAPGGADSAFVQSEADSAFAPGGADSAFAADSVITVNPVNRVNITTVNSVNEVNTINPEAGINDMAEMEDFLFENPLPEKKTKKKKKKSRQEEHFDSLFGDMDDTIKGGRYFWYNNQDIEDCKRKEDMYFYCHYFNRPEECIGKLIVEMYDCAFVRTEEIQYIAYGVRVQNKSLREILNGDNELKKEDIVKQPTEDDLRLIYDKWCGYVDKFLTIIVINAGAGVKEYIKNALYEYGHNDVDTLLHSPE